MNKLKTDLYGGFPFDLDDWRWEIDAHRAALKTLGIALGTLVGDWNAVITEGIVVTPGTFTPVVSPTTITPGWIAIGGELYSYAGGSVAGIASGQELWLEVEEVADASGNEVFEDGSVQDTHFIRRVKLRQGTALPAPGVVGVLIGQTKRIENAHDVAGPWVPITAFEAEWDSPGGIWYRIDPGKVIRFKGAIRYLGVTGAPSGSGAAFTMPQEHRPLTFVRFPIVRVPTSGQWATVGGGASPLGDVGLGSALTDFVSGSTYDFTGVTYTRY